MQLSGPITIDTTLGSGVLVFRSMTAREALGEPFLFDLEVLSQRDDLTPKDLLGQPVSVHLDTADDGTRHFTGLVTRLEYQGSGTDYSTYRLILRPWVWFLTRSTNSRVFQQQSVPDIIKKIFRDYGFTDFTESLHETHPVLDYVVQYRETDFDFVSRLMERAGIYYFFQHTADRHQLVLADSYGSHEAAPGYETLPFRPPDVHRDAALEFVERWELTEEVTPGRYSNADFDFTRPNLRLFATRAAPKDHANAAFEVYEYPGRFLENADGDAIASVRLEQSQAAFEVGIGASNARGLGVGNLFSLVDHPRGDQNREYLVTAAEYVLRGHDLTSGGGEDGDAYRSTFEARDSKVPFRLPLSTEKPIMRGPQTATVVGKAGEEIWTDEYGRVKVQFHWDREGLRDENSSCFVRVSQGWSGDHWGSIHIPRIGHEVIVDFLEGDPDQPIITGRVYNGQNKPPYDLPANQTQSGIKSRSTKGGGSSNFNEIRFEDKLGSEELHMQAEKDHTVLVKHDQS
ncbi:MAG TPA: type VI secretion system tip protein VgrG, partial [Polyangiaceae bacterium]